MEDQRLLQELLCLLPHGTCLTNGEGNIRYDIDLVDAPARPLSRLAHHGDLSLEGGLRIRIARQPALAHLANEVEQLRRRECADIDGRMGLLDRQQREMGVLEAIVLPGIADRIVDGRAPQELHRHGTNALNHKALLFKT